MQRTQHVVFCLVQTLSCAVEQAAAVLQVAAQHQHKVLCWHLQEMAETKQLIQVIPAQHSGSFMLCSSTTCTCSAAYPRHDKSLKMLTL